ncbi:ATP-grasp domain-containing protein [Archangium violaceum]|uniref:ATP-grasp domain-containing protein n=1 Tax=Archangium violaceum TaxID=83451 RepID=UPI001951444B|nr:ATP-grasp domain-containing protein [Archangium violaceum]QRO00740.1 ATP-grasp domain-containing protein [Archangium violaceum]
MLLPSKSPTPRVFVQVGATRDGLDPYLDAARQRGMRALLIETPAYLRWRQQLGRRPFDEELPVAHPARADEVLQALESHGHSAGTALVLAGFERYVSSAFTLAALLGPRARGHQVDGAFRPVDKWGQRDALTRKRPEVLQPRYARFTLGAPEAAEALSRVGFPQVIKPSNGGGGLGVFLVEDASQRDQALTRLGALANYDGSPFTRVLIEEFIDGREHSLQGLAWEGRAYLLTTCEKFITHEVTPDTGLRGFREAGHLATHGAQAAPALRALAQACLDATGYRQGPFHVDIIQNARGAFFVEMGFRLSGGGLVALVEKTTGMKWADMVFEACLGERAPELAPVREGPGACVGQVTCTSEDELRAGERLLSQGVRGEVRRIPPPAPSSPAADEETLASDKLRHVGFTGRITVYGRTLDSVRHALAGCISARLGA